MPAEKGEKWEQNLPQSQPADGLPVASKSTSLDPKECIPLAPVQWAVWNALQSADATGVIVSYRKLAAAANATIRGVRDALHVIEIEGGIRSKLTVRTPDEQGMRIEINRERSFSAASLPETKGIAKRGIDYRQTVNRELEALPADGLRMSVSKYIIQTDIADLLRVLPATWRIREHTLVEIARKFPEMTVLEFRRSLLYLAEQAAQSTQPILHHNAWLKGAFQKNEGPFVTERMIEAQLDTIGTEKPKQGKGNTIEQIAGVTDEYEALRRYLAAPQDERAAIDALANDRAVPALRFTAEEKHKDIKEQALIEAARTFYAREKRTL
jgi:hypothetical protein